MMLGEPDSSGRRRPMPIDGSEFNIDCDQVIIAIGQGPNPILIDQLGVEITPRGSILVDEGCRTSRPGIFAGGDIASNEATVIKAMGMGKIAAKSIHDWVKQEKLVQD